MFISASKDTTAKLWDMDQLEDKKTYKTERPVNSAAISPNKDHVVLGGGQVKNLHLILLFRDDEFIVMIRWNLTIYHNHYIFRKQWM